MASGWWWFASGATIAALLVWWRRRTVAGKGGFREILRRPAMWKQLRRSFGRAIAERERARKWNDEDVAAATREWVLEIGHSEDDRRDLLGRLDEQSDRAAFHALRILQDANVQDRLHVARPQRRYPDGGRQSPADRACRLLANRSMPSAIPVLVPLLEHSREETRGAAAFALGRTGDRTAIPVLCRVLSGSDAKSCSEAARGLEAADRAGDVRAECRAELIEPLLHAAATHTASEAFRLAARWDGALAHARFRSLGLFGDGMDPWRFRLALTALTEAGFLIPREELLAMWARRIEGEEWKVDRAREAIVGALGRHGNPADDPLFHELLEGRGEVARAAAGICMQRMGIEDPAKRLWNEHGTLRKPLSAAETQQIAVWMLDSEIANGGLDQYFLNSYSDHWPEALEVLDAFDPTRAAVLREAIARFPIPPSRDRDARCEQLAALHAIADDVFGDLDRKWYLTGVDILSTRVRHAAAHLAEFRRR